MQFGVPSEMGRIAESAQIPAHRMYWGFDSFRGLPPEASEESYINPLWKPGTFSDVHEMAPGFRTVTKPQAGVWRYERKREDAQPLSVEAAMERRINALHGERNRIRLVPGYYNESLTRELASAARRGVSERLFTPCRWGCALRSAFSPARPEPHQMHRSRSEGRVPGSAASAKGTASRQGGLAAGSSAGRSGNRPATAGAFGTAGTHGPGQQRRTNQQAFAPPPSQSGAVALASLNPASQPASSGGVVGATKAFKGLHEALDEEAWLQDKFRQSGKESPAEGELTVVIEYCFNTGEPGVQLSTEHRWERYREEAELVSQYLSNYYPPAAQPRAAHARQEAHAR